MSTQVETGRPDQPDRSVAARPWLTQQQFVLRGLQLGILGGILLGNFSATSLLLHDPRGQRMMVGASVPMTVVLAVHLIGCAILNRLVPPDNPAYKGRRAVLSWMLEGALFPMFYLPIVIVLLVGPPVLRVMESLTQP